MPQGEPTALAAPALGVFGGVAPWQIPDGYLWRSNNVLPRFGRLSTRPGSVTVATPGLGARAMGGLYYRTANGVDRVVGASLTKWKWLKGPTWTDLSGSVSFTQTIDNPTRFAIFQQSGVNWIIGVNNTDPLYAWDGSAAAIVALGGGPPSLARDITTIGNYVVVLNTVESGNRFSVRVRWSAFNNKDSWPALNFADLVAGGQGDNGVAVRALGRLSMAAYLDDSIWIGDAQAGSTAFQFELVSRTVGPCSPSAVVVVGNTHYYLGRDGRVYRFTGLLAEPISDPIDYFLQTSGLSTQFRSVNRVRAWGDYNRFDQHVWWFYPGPNSADPTLAISYHVPTGAMHLHTFPTGMSAGWRGDEVGTLTWNDLTGTWNAIGPGTYLTWDDFGGTAVETFFLGDVTGLISRMQYGKDDAGSAIASSWEFPLKSWVGVQKDQHFDGVESFFDQVVGGPLVTVQIGASPAIAETGDPAYTTLGTHDTTLTTLQKLKTGTATLDTRFASLKYSATSSKQLMYKGGLIYVWGQDVP